ncbi:two component, sigma54 specific, transcriptional regulator, Fis family [Flexistipes sinusarabici DSM 4947]|uniref:Two component, sigma54 specific, transcriptional regulator, Fis family n=3 Tax=Flexistipes sinusarabici TaxID=2352 RepID=F8E707_FLESM|nr:sigma-54 dependent transcriptional regulator [Flexistipes sinusarabici]AEI14870.1 two component, sigma54 specific, transcriptional regulator, Fis family [Flexistipes sinusarabici DSM 4947]
MKILIIDDEINICTTIQSILTDEGYEAEYALSFNEGMKKLKHEIFDVIFLDIWLPDHDGSEGLHKIKKYFPETEVIMISGHGNIENAVETIKYGAYDYLEKPLSLDRIILIIKHLEDKLKLKSDLKEYKFNLLKKYELIGTSEPVKQLKSRIEKIAPTNAWVLITGENGTGKEHVARLIHLLSKKSNNKFVEINCSAIPSELMESEMFGYEKGAFTGAANRKIGKLESGNKGTIFLDEIGDMDINLQAKLLRVLETGEFTRVGGNEVIRSDFRIISATNKDLEKEIDRNNFREDLYYRINVIPIYVPPLRKRKDDIPLLTNYFIKESCQTNGLQIKKIDKNLMDIFMEYTWPGNVRQLKNIIERMVVLTENDILTVKDAPEFIMKNFASNNKKDVEKEMETIIYRNDNLKKAKERFEKYYILKTLQNKKWNVSQSAKYLGIERTYLHKKIKDYSLDQFRD